MRLNYQWFGFKQKQKEITSVVIVDLKVVLSYTHPLSHSTVGTSVTLEELNSRWYWGTANIWQELRLPSGWTGIPTMSFWSWDKFVKISPSSRELMSQWWAGTAATKLFSMKWQGSVKRPRKLITTIIIWNLPKPLISERTFSNLIVVSDGPMCRPSTPTKKWKLPSFTYS